jgi:hypothetical protein
MAKTYRVRVELDLSKVESSAGRMDAAGRKMEESLGRSAERGAARAAKAEQAKVDQLSRIQDRYALDDYNRAVRREQRGQAAAERGVQAEARAAERKAASLAALEDKYLLREYQGRVKHEQRKQALVEAAARESADRQVAALGRAETAIRGGVLVALGLVGQHYRDIAEQAEAAVASTVKLQTALRGRAAVEGLAGPDLAMVGDTANLMRRAGMTAEQAVKFGEAWASGVSTAVEAHAASGGKVGFSAAEAAAIRPEVARYAQRTDLDPRTLIEYLNTLGTRQKIATPEAAVGLLDATFQAAAVGKGDPRQLMAKAAELSAQYAGEGGLLGSGPEVAAMLAAVSNKAGDPAEAATKTRQALRGLETGLGRAKKGPGAKMSNADYFKSINITENMSAEERLERIYQDFQKNGKGRNTTQRMMELGFTNIEEREGLRALLDDYDLFKKGMENARKAGQGDAAVAKNEEFFRGPVGRGMQAAAAKEIVGLTEGKQREQLDLLMKEVEATPEWRAREKSWGGMLENRLGDVISLDPSMQAGRRMALEHQAIVGLETRATAGGITWKEIGRLRDEADKLPSTESNADFVNRLTALMESRGIKTGAPPGDAALGSLAKVLERLSNLVEEQNKLLHQDKGVAPALDKPPPGQAGRR